MGLVLNEYKLQIFCTFVLESHSDKTVMRFCILKMKGL